MNPLIKTTSILTITGVFAGLAFAGPGDAYPAFGSRIVKKTESCEIACVRVGKQETANVKTIRLSGVNPKTHAAQVVTVTSSAKNCPGSAVCPPCKQC